MAVNGEALERIVAMPASGGLSFSRSRPWTKTPLRHVSRVPGDSRPTRRRGRRHLHRRRYAREAVQFQDDVYRGGKSVLTRKFRRFSSGSGDRTIITTVLATPRRTPWRLGRIVTGMWPPAGPGLRADAPVGDRHRPRAGFPLQAPSPPGPPGAGPPGRQSVGDSDTDPASMPLWLPDPV